ncbi:protein LYRIC-like [Grus japonensis]|uniref:Protein LYRIC-like n=1 Tax=Grus japonensis TaxID=30415 RepID=A0ABC9WJV1_GRUJA
MLGPAVRLALGAGELVPPAPGLPARLLALLWPALVLAAAALLTSHQMIGAPELGQVPVSSPYLRLLYVASRKKLLQVLTAFRSVFGITHKNLLLCGEEFPYVPVSRCESCNLARHKVPVNGQLITSVNIRQKKLLKPKRKRKAQSSDKEVSKDLLSVEKDKLQEEEGVWQTKISSREKRHLRKERLKQKDRSRASQGSSAVEPAFDWDEKRAVWQLTEDTSGRGKGAKAECRTELKASGAIQEELVPSQSEEDVFSNVGTWDIAEVKSCPVTFGTLSELSRELDNIKSKSSEDSPSRCCWHAGSTFLPVDDAWQGQDDPSALDLDSDWKAPTEEWGNWTGDEEHQTGNEKEKPQQGLETTMEEGPRDLLSTKHSSDAGCASFRKSLDVANNSPNNGVPGKKERRKRKKMKKET